MTIYSWNMLHRNRDQDRAFAFIAESDFDIFCLQEVPEGFLARLQTLPCSIVSRTDAEKTLPSGVVPMFNVILSRYPLTGHGDVSFDDYWHLLPLYSRLFIFLMRPFHFSRVRNRGGLYADVEIRGASVRVFDLHLALAHPMLRVKEFEQAMLERDPERPTIVCGDFNILEKPHITPLNWLLGGRMSDVFFSGRERTSIEERFVEHELVNALRHKITHPLSRSQLDHILVSRSFSIRDATVLPDRVGSDHHPIRVDVA